MPARESMTVIVPCFNEQEALPYLYEALIKVFDELDCDCTMLLVDDGSRDKTLEVMRTLAVADERVRYLSFARNFGKEAALYAGLCNAQGDYVAVMDADMQDPPTLLPQMLATLRTGAYDTVAARRGDRKGEPPIRSWFAHRFYGMMRKLSDADMMDGARDFRLMTRRVVDAIVAMGEYNRFSKGLFSWVGFRTCWIPYENVERVAGQTKWSFWGLFRYAVEGLINFSQTPLSIASWFGMIMTVLSFLALIFIVVRKLVFGDPVAGWASTICIIVFVGGIQLFCLGIIGQYIAKIFVETKHRPHYIASESNLEDPQLIR